MLGWFQDDAENALDACFWAKSLLKYNELFGQAHLLQIAMPRFEEVRDNFDTYWQQSKALFAQHRFGNDKQHNLALNANAAWTIRNASHYQKKDATFFVDLAIKRLVAQQARVQLHPEGITLAKITLEGVPFRVALHSTKEYVDPDYIRIGELCELVDTKEVQVLIEDGHLLIAYLEEGQAELVLQVLSDDWDHGPLWLKYLGIYVAKDSEASWLSTIPKFWEDWTWGGEEADEEAKLTTVSLTSQVTFYGYQSADKKGCFRRSKDMLNSAGYNTVAPNDSSAVQMTKYNEQGILTLQEDYQNGIDLINNHLDSNKPIVVGVDWKSGHTGNYDKTTDHWVVVIGREVTLKETCYLYHDPQASQLAVGTDANNKLCIRLDGTLSGRYRKGTTYDRTYTVTMVRPSIKK